MSFPVYSPRGRTTDAPLALDVSTPGREVGTLEAFLRRFDTSKGWTNAWSKALDGPGGYVVAALFVGLVLVVALTVGRTGDAAAALPPPAPNAMFDNVVRLHAREIGSTCWQGFQSPGRSARLTVALEVGLDGKIRYAQASGETPFLRDCVQRHVATWEFLPQAQAQTMALPVEVDRK